jgi:YVTN family beta-propeller protein
LAALDIATETVIQQHGLEHAPSGLCFSADGAQLFVTAGAEQGMVLEIDSRSGQALRRLSAGHTPLSPVHRPDGSTLYVCNRFSHDVSAIDLESGRTRVRIPVPREPIAAAITPDGTTLVVANHLPSGAANGTYTGAAVSLIDTATEGVTASIVLPNGSSGLRGICVSPDGRHGYATHILGRYGLPATHLDRGWVNTNALSIIDLEAGTRLGTVLLDDVDLGAANPWGVVCTPDGTRLCVAHSGTHEISVIERLAMHEKLDGAADASSDLTFLVGIRRRVRLVGNGPRGLAISGQRVLAAMYFTNAVDVVELEPAPRDLARSIALGPERTQGPARRGERLFHDAEICFQGWHTCASCHPDGRSDGLNWDLLNDGVGNPKNAKSLVLSHDTPPAMITGVRDGALSAVRSGIRHIHFAVASDDDAEDIVEYLRTLQPVVSPYAVEGRGGKVAQRGKAVFDRAGCSLCHPPPLYTDLNSYDVGTGTGRDAGRPFDTPTLVEVWRTAPYLGDGRAATLREAIAIHDALLRAPDEPPLAGDELDDLTGFVLTL